MGQVMTAMVAKGDRKRVFLSPTNEHIWSAERANADRRPLAPLPERALGFAVQGYGLRHWHELFTERQLTALTALSDLVLAVQEEIVRQGESEEYAGTVCTYLGCAISKVANINSALTSWMNDRGAFRETFARQAIPMVWDFAEGNPFTCSGGSFTTILGKVQMVVGRLPVEPIRGEVHLADASTTSHADMGPIIVTDPPYYDNIGYSHLSDFFYVWLRPILRDIYPDLFGGVLVPKEEELVAAPRFEKTKERFEDLMGKTLRLIRDRCTPEFPSCIFYAYKQKEERRNGMTSTGWETMLSAIINAGFQIVGTWPMRTESPGRSRALGANALASSVILICRPRGNDAPKTTRRQFLDALKADMPTALDHLTREGHIAPTDLAQAAIGPGMEIFSRYSSVNTISGEPVTVGDALAAINQVINDYHEAQEGEIDTESRFCVDWLKEHGFTEGDFGEAELLSKARDVAIDSDAMIGLLTAESGRVKLRRMDDYGPDRPLTRGMTAWEGCMRMAWHFNREHGELIDGAARVAREMAGLGADVESVERLARILYNHFDRKSDSSNAVAFNNVVTSWQDILTRMQQAQNPRLL